MDIDDAIEMMRGLSTATANGGGGGGGNNSNRAAPATPGQRSFLRREWVRVALRESSVVGA